MGESCTSSRHVQGVGESWCPWHFSIREMCHLEKVHEGQLVWCLPKCIYSSLRFGRELMSWLASASAVASAVKEGVWRCSLWALCLHPSSCFGRMWRGDRLDEICIITAEGKHPAPPALPYSCPPSSCSILLVCTLFSTVFVSFPYFFSNIIHLVPQSCASLAVNKAMVY